MSNDELRSIRPSEHRPRPPENIHEQNVLAPARKFQFIAIDRGFGLDAEVMIERSQRLHAHHRGKVPTPQPYEPVVLNASTTLGVLAKSAATPSERAELLTSRRAQTSQREVPAVLQAHQAATQQQQTRTQPQTVNQTAQKFVSPIQRIEAHDNNVHFHALPALSQQTAGQNLEVSGTRAFCAFVADLCIPVSILVSFLVTQGTWQPGLEQTLARLATRSHTWDVVERTYLWFPWLVSVVAACGLTFVTQYFCAMLGHNSFGRSLCGMNLKKMNAITHVFLVALFEALTFGGLLTLPLLFLIPNRLPLFPWIQFKIRS